MWGFVSLGFRVQRLWLRVTCLGYRVHGLGIWLMVFGYWYGPLIPLLQRCGCMIRFGCMCMYGLGLCLWVYGVKVHCLFLGSGSD